jgi:multiple sugar transport system permease protein
VLVTFIIEVAESKMVQGRVPSRQRTGRKGKRLLASFEGYLFIAPAMIVIGAFGLLPIFYTVYVSLHRWRIVRGRFLGLSNYAGVFGSLLWISAFVAALVVLVVAFRLLRRGFSRGRVLRRSSGALLAVVALLLISIALPELWSKGDKDVFDALRVTIFYSAGTVPIQLAGGVLLAAFLDQRFRGKQAYRVIYLLPYIVPTVASAAVFQVLFSLRPESLANLIVHLFGGKPLGWLGDGRGVLDLAFGWGKPAGSGTLMSTYWSTWAQGPSLALVAIMIYNFWVYTGYYALIYANGLATIPKQLYEAADVDGAGPLTKFRRITWPLLSPTTYFLTMLGIIGTFKSFNSVYVLRSRVIGNAVDTLSINIFYTFFGGSRFGYAAAVSLFLFVLVLGLTYIQRRLMEDKIHYGE